jgi:hypothetical protein
LIRGENHRIRRHRDAPLPLFSIGPDALARAEAEDRALIYLCDEFCPQVAAGIAVRVELLLALRWKAEQDAVVGPEFPREVVVITEPELREVEREFVAIPSGATDSAGEKYVLDLFATG